MEIDLTQLEADGARVEESFGPEGLWAEGGTDRYEPLGAELSAWVRVERGRARATGTIRARVRAECDRCLKPVEAEVAGEFDQRYAWGGTGDAPRGEETEVDPSELDLERLAAPVVDTRELAREQIELNAPIRFLCRADCAGLCPVCRTDLNVASCACEVETTDPRWDALKILKKN